MEFLIACTQLLIALTALVATTFALSVLACKVAQAAEKHP
jgi:hypothetical protein